MRYNEGANFDDDVYWNMNPLLNLAEDVEVYINWLDQNITHGQLNDNTRNLMRDALNQIDVSRNNYLLDRVKLGMYFALISSDYSVIK